MPQLSVYNVLIHVTFISTQVDIQLSSLYINVVQYLHRGSNVMIKHLPEGTVRDACVKYN